jgi:uncharacterized protein (DUF1684 family)
MDSELEQFRKMKDQFFKSDASSPLTPEQRDGFSALNYFPENEALRFELDIEPLPEPEKIEMQTSTGDIQTYLRWGKVKFEVGGEKAELTLFVPQGGHGYFLPFTDTTSDKETYGAGRYLDPEPLPGGKLLIDFNVAYNPYCAYNEYWSCPITPVENRLKVAIEAGEKSFH